MSEEEETDFFEVVEKLNRAGNFLRFITWALVGFGAAGVGVAWWVWDVNSTQDKQGDKLTRHDHQLEAVEIRARGLETWRATSDATPRVTILDLHALDKRLGRTEDQLTAIQETLRRIETKIP